MRGYGVPAEYKEADHGLPRGSMDNINDLKPEIKDCLIAMQKVIGDQLACKNGCEMKGGDWTDCYGKKKGVLLSFGGFEVMRSLSANNEKGVVCEPFGVAKGHTLFTDVGKF